jgi:hypothetical protein
MILNLIAIWLLLNALTFVLLIPVNEPPRRVA